MEMILSTMLDKMWLVTDNTSWTEPQTGYGRSISFGIELRAMKYCARDQCDCYGLSYHCFDLHIEHNSPVRSCFR
jgi:hypothetical protein